ncbi:TolC family protein [Flavobacterium sp. GT3R68]|uniref:TolC family protein n=1 Tax=Flavobacterium sp. GT3R68 TaxID=2594437 RepID=UPI000F871507|nr:TolC family protein [Flavobacterium sp. GT3R68]RTY90016.1 TolC family protein [Flavobacterium sp. GSN2]TRW93339.1 TolC family protein [Flavobacterium sp. GT3R68]
MKETVVSKITLIFALLAGVFSQAQTKQWTLAECVDYAIKNNISIKQSQLDNQIAAIDKRSAVGNFLPTLSADVRHSWNIGLNTNVITNAAENQTTQYTSASLSSGFSIYNGLQNQNRLRRANLSLVAAQYQLTKMKDDVALNVANAFLQILFNKENVKVQKEQLTNTDRQMQRSQELVNAGVIPRGDLLDIKATTATNAQAIVNAENALLISKLSLAQLLQLDNFEDFDIADSDNTITESSTMLQTPASIYEKAKEERVELKIAKTNMEIAEKDMRIARGAYQPSLSGFYSFSTSAGYSDRVVGFEPNASNPYSSSGAIVNVNGTDYNVMQANYTPILGKPEPIFNQFSDNKGHNFGVLLSIPILNGFSVRNNVERSKVALERSKIAFSQQELDLERNVFTAFTDAKGALKAYESAVTALEARQEAYNYAKEKYAVGMMNAFDFNQSQTLFVNAQSEVLRTKYDYIFRVKVLEFYFGIPIIQKQ